ncbi:hypothetical protein EU537_07775 [Candidatus Thorarchaeota archaeon]|nr:MAG: hypothetical protein EU537_07775 [Candidatus Thorarchaeota archaeon]
MKLPVCVFDLETDMLCPNCQERLERGEITKFEIDFCKWILEKRDIYPSLEELELLKAIQTDDLLILVVKKGKKQVLTSNDDLMGEIEENYGETLVVEGPAKLHSTIRSLIKPAVEVGVNSLYLPTGVKESIVILRSEDKDRIAYTKEQLRDIATAIVGDPVIFQFQSEREKQEERTEDDDAYEEKMMDFTRRRP